MELMERVPVGEPPRKNSAAAPASAVTLPCLLLCCAAFLAGYLVPTFPHTWLSSRVADSLPELLPTPHSYWSSQLQHVPRDAVCDGRYWDDLITVILTQDGRPTSSPFVGHRRLYRTLLKVLCGHPIVVGVSGTSVSAGHGVDFDTHRVYSALVYQWLLGVPLLPQASAHYHRGKLRHGYRNTGVGGLGTDLTSLCLSSFWSNSTGIFNRYIAPLDDPTPDPFAETSMQMAERVGASTVVADLVFVEFLANDYRWAKLKHAGGGSWTFTWNDTNAAAGANRSEDGDEDGGDEVKMDPGASMTRLLDGLVGYDETAIVLLNTLYATHEALDTIEEDYRPAADKYDIPVISYYRRWYGNRSSALQLEERALARFVRDRYMVDTDHFNDIGHHDIASFIIFHLQDALYRITDAIDTYTAANRSDAAPLGRVNTSVSPHWKLSAANGGGSETYCAMAFTVVQLLVQQLKNPLIARGFSFQEAPSDSVAKSFWKATTDGAELAFDCLSLVSRPPPLNVDRVYISYLGTWNPQAGVALIWITANVSFLINEGEGLHVVTDSVLINVTTPRRFDSHWALSQTTATAKNMQLYSASRLLKTAVHAGHLLLDQSAKLCISKGSGCAVEPQFHSLTLRVLTVDANKTFSFVGFFIRVRG